MDVSGIESGDERDDWRRLYEAATALARPLGEGHDFQPFARLLEDILRADSVELIVVEDDAVIVHGSSGTHSFVVTDGDPRSVDTLVSLRPAGEPRPQIVSIGDARETHGVIAVYRERALDDRDRLILETLSTQITVRIRNDRLFAEALEQARFARIVAHTADGIFAMTADGTIASWNPAMERITGRHRDRAIGRPCEDVLGSRMARAVDSLLVGSAGGTSQTTVERPDGSLRWLRLRDCSIGDQGPPARPTVIVAHDVTAEVQAEELKHDFVSLISHELRTPLTPLKGFLRSLLDGTVEDAREARYEYYRIMLRQTERLERLIVDLLDVSQIQSGNLLVEAQRIELGHLIHRQTSALERQHPDRIWFHRPPTPLLVRADATRIEQVLSTLISNALKHSPPDTPIDVSAGVAEGRAIVAVRDRGPGIAQTEQERVFEPFYRSETMTNQRTKGVGVGLFIARNVIEAMGGELRLSSRLGEGSTFAFTLPLAGAAETNALSVPNDRTLRAV